MTFGPHFPQESLVERPSGIAQAGRLAGSGSRPYTSDLLYGRCGVAEG